MITLSSQFLSVMVIIMLAVVGGLVLWLHHTLYQLKKANNKAPVLVEHLSESIKKANRGIFEMSRLVREEGPLLGKELSKAQETAQDLEFMLAKAEKILKRMDSAFEKADNITTPLEKNMRNNEKNVLLGQQQKTAPKPVEPVLIPSEKAETLKGRKKMASEKTNAGLTSSQLKSHIDKHLERESLLSGRFEEEKGISQTEVFDEQPPRRMASPMRGAMAYGQQFSVTTSDSERDLRQALEGRL